MSVGINKSREKNADFSPPDRSLTGLVGKSYPQNKALKNKENSIVIHKVIHRKVKKELILGKFKKKEKRTKKEKRKENIYINIYTKERKKMTCFNPIRAWRYKSIPIDALKKDEYTKYNKTYFHSLGKNGQEIKLPCGKCLGCRLDHASHWQTRMYLEMKQWEKGCFITLTYNDKNLPKNNKFRPKDMTNFLKKLRKQETGDKEWINPVTKKKEKPIRYFYCAERGTKNKRVHYHIAIFNYIPDDLKYYKKSDGSGEKLYTSKKIYKLWGKGFCPIGEINIQSMGYIARYVQKKAYSEEKNDEYIRMSRMPGIGITEWIKNKDYYMKENSIIINNKGKISTKPLPRYFEKLWEKENWYSFEKHRTKKKEIGEKNAKQIINQYKISNKHNFDNRKEIMDNTKKNIIEKKSTFLKRKL